MTDYRPDPSTHSRSLMRGAIKAALATALPTAEGWPYASLVTVAHDHDLSPILLLSQLSDHTRAIDDDPRVSLLYDETDGFANPQQGPRVTLLGRAEKIADETAAKRFLARHPRAALYAGFGDFSFYKVVPDRVHYVGGFAAAHWIPWRRVGAPDPETAAAFRESEDSILEHMNSDHADAIRLMANNLLGFRGKYWTMFGIDADGIDLRLNNSSDRLDFDAPLQSPGDSRKALIELTRKARAAI
ncbi:MAG: DUF2470 domain-containing protein [Rhodospirillales bacterium]